MAINKNRASPQSITVVLQTLEQRYIELAEQIANGTLSLSEAKEAGRALDRELSIARNAVKAVQLN
jgi:hypothetical protein